MINFEQYLAESDLQERAVYTGPTTLVRTNKMPNFLSYDKLSIKAKDYAYEIWCAVFAPDGLEDYTEREFSRWTDYFYFNKDGGFEGLQRALPYKLPVQRGNGLSAYVLEQLKNYGTFNVQMLKIKNGYDYFPCVSVPSNQYFNIVEGIERSLRSKKFKTDVVDAITIQEKGNIKTVMSITFKWTHKGLDTEYSNMMM